MARRVNTEALALIKRWEGLRLDAYQDVGGIWTIGYGSTNGVAPGMKITKAEADRRLKADLADAETAVEGLVKQELTENQFGALVSFVFNVGVGAFRSSTLLRKLNAGDFAAVPVELVRWNKARVNGRMVPVEGLSNRRAAEAGLWSRGAFVASNTVEAAPERAPAGKSDIAVGTAGVGAAGTIIDHVTANADTIQTAAWFLRGQTWLMIGAGLVLVGCAAWLAWSWYKRSRG